MVGLLGAFRSWPVIDFSLLDFNHGACFSAKVRSVHGSLVVSSVMMLLVSS